MHFLHLCSASLVNRILRQRLLRTHKRPLPEEAHVRHRAPGGAVEVSQRQPGAHALSEEGFEKISIRLDDDTFLISSTPAIYDRTCVQLFLL